MLFLHFGLYLIDPGGFAFLLLLWYVPYAIEDDPNKSWLTSSQQFEENYMQKQQIDTI